MSSPLNPIACVTMIDVRAGVDDIDRQIVDLIARRFEFMDAAARIKSSRSAVRDEGRKADVLSKVDLWAKSRGVDRDLIRRCYDDLVETSIAYELREFDRTRS